VSNIYLVPKHTAVPTVQTYVQTRTLARKGRLRMHVVH